MESKHVPERDDIKTRIALARDTESGTGRGRAVRILAAVFVFVLFASLGTAFGVFFWGSETFRRAVVGHFGQNPFRVWTVERQFPGRTSLNVLVLGVDRDMDNRRRILKTNGRSDSILVARVDFANRTIRALTIPRDTAVRVPGYRGVRKVNAAHALGGPELTAETIRDVFGIPTDSYVTINFDGFCQIVDAIGGVEINVEKRLKYDDNWGGLHVNLYPGFQHLNGYQAMGYVRMRHSDSDEMRSKRQHAFLEAVRQKLVQPSTFLRLPKALDKIADNLKRSAGLTEDQLFALANFARSLPRENIRVETLPSIEGPSYVTVRSEQAEALIREMFFPGSTGHVNIGTPDPSTVAALNSRYGGPSAHRRRSATREETQEGRTETTEVEPDADPGPEEPPPDAGPDDPATGGVPRGEGEGSDLPDATSG